MDVSLPPPSPPPPRLRPHPSPPELIRHGRAPPRTADGLLPGAAADALRSPTSWAGSNRSRLDWRMLARRRPRRPASSFAERGRMGVCAARTARGGTGPWSATSGRSPARRSMSQAFAWARLALGRRSARLGQDPTHSFIGGGPGPRRGLRGGVPSCRPRYPNPSAGSATPSGRQLGRSRTAPR